MMNDLGHTAIGGDTSHERFSDGHDRHHPYRAQELDYDCRWLDPDRDIRFPSIDAGRSFPLSLLVFLFTLASFFFAVWRVSPEAAIATLFFLTPGLVRTMWVVESRRQNNVSMTFTEQLTMWLSSTSLLVGATFIAAITFLFTFFIVAWLGYVLGGLVLGEGGTDRGLVMGVVLGLPFGCSSAFLLTAGVFSFVWGYDRRGPVDMRN